MSRHASRVVRRGPILLAVAGALVAGGLADRAAAPRPVPAGEQYVQPVPEAAPAGAYSSSWFCAGGSTVAGSYTPGEVILANDGPRPVTGSVSIVSAPAGDAGQASGGPTPPAVVRTVTVGARSSVAVPESATGAAWTGAIVDVDGGSVGVTQVVDSPLGRSASPCATSGSAHWYLPSGQTRINAAETVLLLNPYPTASIVDLSFSTDQGQESPQQFQGLDVPSGGLIAVPLGTHLRRRAAIATTVSARIGNVVAWESEVILPPVAGQALVGTPAADAPLADPAFPVPGVAVMLGAPSAGTSWVWPDGLAGDGVDEQYVIYNPGPQTADVRLSIGLQQGSAEPLDISVGPYQAVQEVSEQQARIPAGVPHTAALVSVNGVPVVAARTVAALDASVAGSASRTGIGQMLGERLAARSWLVPTTSSDSRHSAAVVVEDPGPGSVQVTFRAVSDQPGAGVYTTTVGAGQRVAVPVPTGLATPLEVDASGPVYVETDIYGVGGSGGYGITSAIPLG